MEKNGYIFIKQNFETLDADTEPTLTEIGEVPVQAISDSLKLGEIGKGNQMLKVNGKMVYLQMENKPATREEILEAAKVKGSAKDLSDSKVETLGKVAGNTAGSAQKGGKKIVAKNTYIRRHGRYANILKTNSVKKSDHDINTQRSGKPASVPNIVKNVMKCVNPLQLMTMKQEPVTLLQVVSGNSEQPLVIPVSMVQFNPTAPQIIQSNIVTLNPQVSQQVMSGGLQGVKITNMGSVNVDSSVNRQDIVSEGSSGKAEVIEIQQVHTVDEKGAASELVGSSVSNTPIVSDAPWQGVLNINSEQELLEYINAQSGTAVDPDNGYTILIQNVDTPNGATVSSTLDSQNLLTGAGNLSSVFTDQGAMISDILPVVSSEEAQAHSNNGDGSEIMSTILDGTEDSMNHVIEIRTETEEEKLESGSDIVGVDKIIKIEIDPTLVQVNENDEMQDESALKIETHEETENNQDTEMVVETQPENVTDNGESPENCTGQLLIKEEAEDVNVDAQESLSEEMGESLEVKEENSDPHQEMVLE